MKVLIFLDYFTPAFKAGGPIRIFETLARDKQTKINIGIVTQNIDWGDSAPLAGVTEGQWREFGCAKVLYLSSGKRRISSLGSLLKKNAPDVIHLNSLFSRVWTIKILILSRLGLVKARLFLSPHGELADSALGLKAKRKRVFLTAARSLGLFRRVTWIATSEKEVLEIHAQIYRHKLNQETSIALVPPPLPAPFARQLTPKISGRLRLVFLARLSPMKNIAFLNLLLPLLKGDVRFDIYGPIDPEYAATFESVLARLKRDCPTFVCEYRGPVPSHETARILSNYDLFIQPSLSENFGYSIVEALASGTPVLISDRTPWGEVESERIGSAPSLEKPEIWVEVLQKFIDMDDDEWLAYSRRASAWVAERANSSAALLKVYGATSMLNSASGSASDRPRRSPEDAKSASEK